ncbi:MAG: hypothetical protein IJ189_02130 [Clostridia bacterium]|nr:hypothetical protein [Clostridia bacterium]
MNIKKGIALFLALVLALTTVCAWAETMEASDKEAIEYALNLKNNADQEWTYSVSADAWTLSIVSAVMNPVIAEKEGVSVCVPGAYVTGVDTDGDGTADVTKDNYSESVKGSLVIDYDATVTSTNGQIYTASTAPVILNTGAAGYGSSTNTTASATYAAEGYINVACGNRGKQDSYTDADGNTVYTGDAPSCLVDQKAAARFVKYNISLGNLPGSTEYWVSTGGSGGGAHAAMFAATSNNPDFYDYQIAVGAVGVYRNADGSYSTTVTIDGEEIELSDGAWGCVAYSAITSLYEADMAMAFEYTLNTDYSFNTDFQKALAEVLSQEYMDYINSQNLTVEEVKVGFDLDGDGELNSVVALTIEYDTEKYADTNGYGGTYLDLYLAEFIENLQWYVDSLDYADGWTWFDADGIALSDEAVAAMTAQEKAAAFIEGRYAKSSSAGMGMGGPGGGHFFGGGPGGTPPDGGMGGPGGPPPDGGMGGGPGGKSFSGFPGQSDASDGAESASTPDGEMPSGEAFADVKETAGTEGSGDEMEVGTPDAGTTQSATSTANSQNYASYAEMLAAYQADIAEIEAGDAYGKNIVNLYNPLNYIGAEGTKKPAWTRIVCGATEGDIAMFNSLNLEIAWLNNGTDAVIEWQWDGGHVPSEVLGNSLALYVDQMYGKHVAGAVTIEKPAAEKQTTNGTSESASGADLSSWVSVDENCVVAFMLSDAMRYRTKGASKTTPAFDVIDYGQEDYVFGSANQDARHWSVWVLKALEESQETLETRFN